MSDDKTFLMTISGLRYEISTGYQDTARLGRWQFLGEWRSGFHGQSREVLEDDVPDGRAFEVARLLGREDEMLDALRAQSAQLKADRLKRLQDARDALRSAETRAAVERAEARRLDLLVASLELRA